MYSSTCLLFRCCQEEYRAAFERTDRDGSGFIETADVEQLLREVYEGEDVPPVEISAFIQLFDTDGDGRISWEEFKAALGAVDGADAPSSLPLLAGDEAPGPKLSGTVTVTLDDGSEVEMDATAYMEQLKAEAMSLRKELSLTEEQKKQEQLSVSSSISSYVASLPEDQLKLLTSGISEDVVTAMRQLVTYILRAPSGDGPLGKEDEVTIEQQKLQQLCLYQLVLGYTLREAEAKGEAGESIGR